MQTTNQIRDIFLKFFEKNGHQIVSSSPLVPRNDPTLLFTNAGMVQFKNVFTGGETRDYERAVTSQKCVRAGGKHNDLENVGYTARHHTFFEMLGNFSFGDYFKENAIEYAWDLVTKDLGLPKEKLLVTVYSEDEDAATLWKKIAGLDDQKIIRIPTSDNFWAMGDTGPCGPCSEIFFDHGEDIEGGPPGSANEDGDRFIEIWNLVFMQYEQVTKEERIELPSPSIDTGMGLERIAAILQGSHDNYDIDLMRSLIEASANESGIDPDGPAKVSHRVIADHLRASAFLIADGVLPSNEGRGYVVRRIMRRAMRHAHLLGCAEPLVWRLVPALTRQMGEAFPELIRAESLIVETLKLEETRFKETLARGLRQLEDATQKLSDSENLPGDVAFKLYDTYGFPLDLTQDILRGQGRKVDLAGFDKAMAEQKAAARAAWSGSGEIATDDFWLDIRDQTTATEFLGYSTEQAEGVIIALIINGENVEKSDAFPEDQEVTVICNQTPFYAEAGGQVGDTGCLTTASGSLLRVTDVQKKAGDLFIHIGFIENGIISVGDTVEMKVDTKYRSCLRANHSATHLLHESLRRHLGDHVTQKGSLVDTQKLRFDFSHPRAVEEETLKTVETEVNEQIRENTEVVTQLMQPEDAIKAGAMALFGEKYGEEVRVVSMGQFEVGTTKSRYSTELCGGTHVSRTGDIGVFRLVSEGAVASGVRRIEAVTANGAIEHFNAREEILNITARTLKSTLEKLPHRVISLLEDKKKLENEVAELRRKLASPGMNRSENDENIKIGNITFLGKIIQDIPPRELKSFVDEFKKEVGSGIITVVASFDNKASLVVGVTEDLSQKYNAVTLVQHGVTALGGKGGGGRPDMAQAGGPNIDNLAGALEEIKDCILKMDQ
ncbi:MAG: alanine--tRNA ligase [Nisaea sp.]|nr:alanine--tRNA ligase [Nisaea sp.]MEC7972160.1 alanine--tRNA ligase [Pseudomonadota bacterium]